MRIFSGIQPTGRKHLGNYLGAIRQYVAGQDRGEAIYCIVDLHAITVSYEPDELSRAVLDTTALLMASGLDPDRCILFRQSEVREHTELCWLLTSVTAYGELARMHQFKEKSEQQRDFVSAGLFIYPILQAADILAYQTDEVPVGEDQKQHLELAREALLHWLGRCGISETPIMRSHRYPHLRPTPRSAFAGYRFPPEVITLAVRWYLRFGLSYRDVEELLAERGIEVDHVSIYRWGPSLRTGIRGGGSGPTARHRGPLACR